MAPADETEVYHRMHKWYNSPECDALRAAWGAYPATPAALQAWPGFVAVTNAFLDSDAADKRPAVAAAAEPAAAEAEESVATEAESEPVGASEVVPEVVEGEEGVVTEPVVVSEVMEREAPAEAAADEPRGSASAGPSPFAKASTWIQSRLILWWRRRQFYREREREDEEAGRKRREGLEANTEANEPEPEQAAGEAVGSIGFLGLFKNKKENVYPFKICGEEVKISGGRPSVRIAFGNLVDELIAKNASSGVLAVSSCGFTWSAGPDDKRFRQHGSIDMEVDQQEYIRFADFAGALNSLGGEGEIAVYRVALPDGDLRGKWAGRPPPRTAAQIYSGPRDDGLLSTDDISGDYSGGRCFFPVVCCNSMTVVPHGPDAIETWSSRCCCVPCSHGRFAAGDVWTRKAGTDTFHGNFKRRLFGGMNSMTFSAGGTAIGKECWEDYTKRPGSKKRAFQKVETKDLAGNWCSCCGLAAIHQFCVLNPYFLLFLFPNFYCATKKVLDEDRYEEKDCCCLNDAVGPFTRIYANGHPTNGFATDSTRSPGLGGDYGGDGFLDPSPCLMKPEIQWYRDSGFAVWDCHISKKCC